MASGGKGGKKQTTTTSNAPWAGVQQPLLNYYQGAQDWFFGPQASAGTPAGGKGTALPRRSEDSFMGGVFNKLMGKVEGQLQGGRQYSPEWMNQQMVAGIPPEMQAAWGLTANRALQGSPLTAAAQQSALDTLSGRSFSPFFNTQFGEAAGRLGETFRDITMPAIASRFGMAGRSGSGAEQEAIQRATGQLGRSLGGFAADIYGQERGRQMQALGLAPTLAQQDYADIAQLAGVGTGKRAYEQEMIGAPLQRLQAFGSLLQPGMGFGTQTTQQPLYRNPLASGLGGAAALAPLGPWGAGIGGAVGLLSGKF